MPAVMVSDKLLRVLEDFAPGANLEAKLENLTRESLEHQLRACNEVLSRFEAKAALASRSSKIVRIGCDLFSW